MYKKSLVFLSLSKLTAICILLAVLTSPVFSTSAEFPNTPAGNRAKEIFELLNGTSSYELDGYIKNQYAPSFRDAFPHSAHKAIFETTGTIFGKLKLVDISKSTANEITITLKSKTKDAWLNMSLNVESEKPHRIVSLGLRPGSRPDNVETDEEEENTLSKQLQKKTESKFTNLEELHQYLLKKTKENEFSGAVLIAKDGKPLFHKAYGFASKRFKVPNQPDTKFNLGSCNKLFTAIGIAQLIEDGELSLDDTIGKYLDMFPEEIAGKVTIRHLLNMRSGWGDYWGNDYFNAHKDQLRTVSDYMNFIKDIPLDFEPGSNFQHCNTGYEVAGAIIEKISGMDYYDYIKKHVYEPAGMTNTDSYQKDGPVENLAMGYTNMNSNDPEGIGYKWNNMYAMPPRGTPAGGGYSTAEDILKLDIALRNHKLLNSEYTNFFFNRFKGQLGDPFIPKSIYRALGLAPGISAYIGIDQKTGYTIIVLSNYDSPIVMDAAENIIKMFEID